MDSALIMEDNPETREWLAEVVDDAFPGVTVMAVATLGAGLRALEGKPVDLALVDIGLPDGCGIDLVAKCSRRSPATYCVITTIYDDDQHLLHALKAGAKGYLLKDQPRGRLVSQLAGIVQGEPPLSPAVARRLLRHFSGVGGGSETAPETVAGKTLSSREEDVLSLIARGYSRNEVALALNITPNTAAGYIKNIYRKLEVSGRAEAAVEAAQRGLVGRRPAEG